MFTDLTLFVTIGKKYENIASLSINEYIKFCQNPIKKIFIVCSDDVDISKFSFTLPYDYITDSTAINILNINGNDYKCITDEKWILQQYFKLNCDILSNTDNCIITDCDGLLLKPINYFTKNKLNLFYVNSPDREYATNKIIKYFFNVETKIYDFITENVLFQKNILIEARKLLGDFRQYRNSYNNLYDMPINNYNSIFDNCNPYKQPELTTYKMFHDKSFNNVIFSKLTTDYQEDIIKNHYTNPVTLYMNPKFRFSEYEFYNYFLLINYPEYVNLTRLNIQYGFIPIKDPDFWYNESTPGSREDVFQLMYENKIILR